MSIPNFARVGVYGKRMQIKINETTSTETLTYEENQRIFADMIASAAGISYEIIPVMNGAGQLLPDGNWTGLMGALQAKKIDVALCMMALRQERREAFPFSFPWMYSEETFVTRKHEYEPEAAAILHPFSTHMWIAVIVCLCTMPVFFRLALHRKYSAIRLFMFALSSLLKQEIKLRPKKIPEYFLLAFWFLGIALVGYFYSALLLSFLTFPSLTGISTIKDLADGIREGKYEAVTVVNSYLPIFMLQSNDESMTIIGSDIQRNKYRGRLVSVLEDLAREKKSAYINAKLVVMAFKDFYFISEDRFTFTYYAFPMSEDFCCKAELNNAIHRYWSAGIFEKHESDVNFQEFLSELRNLTPPRQNDSEKRLSLAELKGAFMLLLASHLAALFVLLIEICTAKFV